MIILFCTFSRINLFFFYLFLRVALLLSVFLVLGWGYQPERLQAGIYLLSYMLLATLPMLVGIFYVYSVLNSTCFYLLLKLDSFSIIVFQCSE
jgi:NADH-ubiquinone oxidoreductase chain 4